MEWLSVLSPVAEPVEARHQGRHVPLSGHTYPCRGTRGSAPAAHAQSVHAVGVDLRLPPGLCVNRAPGQTRTPVGAHVGLPLPPDVPVAERVEARPAGEDGDVDLQN